MQGPSPWRPLRWPAIALAAVLAYGVAGYTLVQDWSFVDALYMTLLTLTTVGFREVHPLDTGGKIFTISVLAMGATLVIITLSLVARAVSEGGLGERARRRRMERRVDTLSGHYIVCAYGRVGRTVAREFEVEGVPFVVVESLEDLEDELRRDGVTYLIGDTTSEAVLRDAGILRAKGLVCAMDSDAANVYITLAARSLNPNLFIVARAAESSSADRLYRAGADRVISPYVSSGRHMALLALRPSVVDYLDVSPRDAPTLRLEELEVEARSHLVGRAVSEACGLTMPLAVRRSTGQIITNPDPELVLEAGDLLVLLGERDALRPVEGA